MNACHIVDCTATESAAHGFAIRPQTEGDLEIAYRLVSRLVRDEYPDTMSLAESVAIWGDASEDELAALRRIEARGQWGAA